MKNLIFIGILLSFTTPAFSELSDSDLQRIREIVQVEVLNVEQRLQAEMRTAIEASEKRMTAAIEASEKRMTEYQNIKLTELDKRMDLLASLLIGIMALIVLAVGAPQLILAYRQRKQEQVQQNAIQELRAAYEEVLVQLKELKVENEAIKQRESAHAESHSSKPL